MDDLPFDINEFKYHCNRFHQFTGLDPLKPPAEIVEHDKLDKQIMHFVRHTVDKCTASRDVIVCDYCIIFAKGRWEGECTIIVKLL